MLQLVVTFTTKGVFLSHLGEARPLVIYQAIWREATCSQCVGLCTLPEFPASAATYFYFIQQQMIGIPYRRTIYVQSCIVVLSNTAIIFLGSQENKIKIHT
jgi:hypothetical protein